MCTINHLSPERMTPPQRRREVASLLAHGLVRLREQSAAPSANMAAESAFALGFSAPQRVHTDPDDTRPAESK